MLCGNGENGVAARCEEGLNAIWEPVLGEHGVLDENTMIYRIFVE